MTLNLWRAEWIKTRKRPINRGMLVIMLALLLVFFAGMTVLALVNRAMFLDAATGVLSFPMNLGLSIEMLSSLGSLLAVIFVANSVGGEYTRDTWKVIIPRYGSRRAFLLTKWVAGLVAMLLLAASVIAVALLLGWLGTLILGIPANPSGTVEIGQHLRHLGLTFVQLSFTGTLTLFGAVATRSTIGAAITGILVPVILALLQVGLPFLLKGAAIVLPPAHFDNLRSRWVTPSPEADALMARLFNRSVPPAVSALVVLGYILLLLGAALYLFERRDLAGE